MVARGRRPVRPPLHATDPITGVANPRLFARFYVGLMQLQKPH